MAVPNSNESAATARRNIDESYIAGPPRPAVWLSLLVLTTATFGVVTLRLLGFSVQSFGLLGLLFASFAAGRAWDSDRARAIVRAAGADSWSDAPKPLPPPTSDEERESMELIASLIRLQLSFGTEYGATMLAAMGSFAVAAAMVAWPVLTAFLSQLSERVP